MTFAATLAVLTAVVFMPPHDTIPSRARARANMVRFFPAVAPTSLMKSTAWRTRRLSVEPARRCARTKLRVECSFVVLLVARRGNPNAPVRCKGELWAKQRAGVIIGRVGDYRCVTYPL